MVRTRVVPRGMGPGPALPQTYTTNGCPRVPTLGFTAEMGVHGSLHWDSLQIWWFPGLNTGIHCRFGGFPGCTVGIHCRSGVPGCTVGIHCRIGGLVVRAVKPRGGVKFHENGRKSAKIGDFHENTRKSAKIGDFLVKTVIFVISLWDWIRVQNGPKQRKLQLC